MKKVAFMFVAAMAISFASCGGQTKATEEVCDSAAACCEDTAVVEEVVDTLVEEVVDSAAAVAEEVAAEVVAE
ncbi:MAG: hypothetical protein K6A32_02705 [Bacteroidales bacterium]|nr:hypothetical protein [Bacteroidales bacterium]